MGEVDGMEGGGHGKDTPASVLGLPEVVGTEYVRCEETEVERRTPLRVGAIAMVELVCRHGRWEESQTRCWTSLRSRS